MSLNELDEETLKAIKKLVKGYCVKEVIDEYVLDKDGNKVLAKQKISKKIVPPNTDIVKLLYSSNKENNNFSSWTDEQLEVEKQRLLKMLKQGEENEYRAN